MKAARISYNRKFILGILFKAIMIYGIALLPTVWIAINHENSAMSESMVIVCFLSITFGKVLSDRFNVVFDNMKVASMRACYMTTVLTWFVLIALSALPYYYSSFNISLIDSLFESCSSWTTTGATTVDVFALPLSLKLWRATCNWLGGLGIIIMTLTFLPNWQFVGQNLVATEVSGPGFLKLKSTFRKSYRRLLFVYIALTIGLFVALVLQDMSIDESLLTALGCTSTAGMLNINNGILTHLSFGIKLTVTIFTLLSSLNFSFLIMLILGKFRVAFRGVEYKFHVGKLLIATVCIFIFIHMGGGIVSKDNDFLTILMQVTSYTSTSAFIVTDCSKWPSVAKALIVLLVFTGGCAVSTTGGIKNARIIVACKAAFHGLYKSLHPNAVKTLSYNGETLKNQTVIRSNLYIMMFMSLYILGALLLSWESSPQMALEMSQSMLTNSGSSIMNISNGGRILGWSTFSKAVMMFLMLAGRLEIYPMLLLFFKSFWKKNSNI